MRKSSTSNSIAELAHQVENYAGVRRKGQVGRLLTIFDNGNENLGLGDDCGFLRWGDDYLLVTTDSIRQELLGNAYFGGYAGVNATCNDIYAMGGTPLMLVNTIWAREGDEQWIQDLARGMQAACRNYGVPMVGGHLDPDAGFRALSVSALGVAHRLITSSGAKPGDSIIVAYDLDGEGSPEFMIWDSSTRSEPEVLRKKLSVMIALAERDLVSAARDISNAGLLGSLQMLLEESRAAAEVDLEEVPRPDSIPLAKWLLLYPSYGFIMTASPPDATQIVELFTSKGLSASPIGRVTEGKGISIKMGDVFSNIFMSGKLLNREGNS